MLKALKAKGTIESLRAGVLYAIAGEAFFVGLFPALAELCLLIGFVIYLIKWKLDDEYHFQKTRYFWPITIFALFGLASVAVSPDSGFSFFNYYNLVGVYLLTYVMVTQNIHSRSDLHTVAMALASSAVLVVVYGLFQYFVGIDTNDMKWVDGNAFPELRKRIFSTWENPNILAAYMDIVICVLVGMFAKIDQRIPRQYIGTAILISVFILAMTYARGACLTIAVILAGYGIVRDKRILIGVVVVAVGALALDPVLLERMTNMFTVADTSSEMRVAMWESTIQMIMDHPILGIGWGAYWMVYPLYDTYIVDGSVMLVHAHNIYLNYICEIGVFGGIAYFVWLFGNNFTALTSTKCFEDKDKWIEGLQLGFGLALVSVALNGLTDDVLFNIPSSMLLWMICGLINCIEEKI